METIAVYIGILSVVLPGSFWVLRAFIMQTVKKTVDTQLEQTNRELQKLTTELKQDHDSQTKIERDIDWIRKALDRLESKLATRQ